jgi:hypothetical protein
LGLRGLYRNDPVVNKTAQMLIALALLPSTYAERGYQIIERFYLNNIGEASNELIRKMDQLLRYRMTIML